MFKFDVCLSSDFLMKVHIHNIFVRGSSQKLFRTFFTLAPDNIGEMIVMENIGLCYPDLQ